MNWRPKDWENLWDKQPSDCLATPSPVWEAGADAMLEAVCEEIGKVEKVYPDWVSESVRCIYDDGFEDCRKAILALLQKETP